MVRSFFVSLSIAAALTATCWAAKPHHKHVAAAPTDASAAAAPAASTPAVSAGVVAGMTIPAAPQVDARSYILVDYQTGKVLAAADGMLSSTISASVSPPAR